jgi:hypothetical protein
MPALLSDYVQNLLTWGDMLDFFTPLALIPVACIPYQRLKSLESNEKSLENIKNAASFYSSSAQTLATERKALKICG